MAKEREMPASSYLGGHLKELVPPLERFYRTPGERPVRVQIMRYYGIGAHYYVSIKEEFNPILQTREGKLCTVECWDDQEGRGREVWHPKFNSVKAAERWIEKTLKTEFKGQPVTFDDLSDKTKWHYRDGD